jgi:excisionase family DNA binding protein
VKGSGRGKQAKFRREDVDKITSAYRAASERRENQSTALTTTKRATDTSVALVVETMRLIGEVRAATLAVVDKAILSVEEAAQFGFSRNELLEAIHAGKLKAHKRAGWRIKRTDLDSYIKKL